MSTFKVGQKVVRKKGYYNDMVVGNHDTVTGIHDSGIELDKYGRGHSPDCLSLVEETWRHPSGNFKNGARVRVINHNATPFGYEVVIGSTGTVVEDNNPMPFVIFDQRLEQGKIATDNQSLELIEDSKSDSSTHEVEAPIFKPEDIYSYKVTYANQETTNRPNGFKRMLQKLTSTLKRVLSASMQSQYKAGLRDDRLALTAEGRTELLELLAAKYEAELTARADEVIAESKEE